MYIYILPLFLDRIQLSKGYRATTARQLWMGMREYASSKSAEAKQQPSVCNFMKKFIKILQI